MSMHAECCVERQGTRWSKARKGQKVMVRKHAPDGQLRLSYPGSLLSADSRRLVVRTSWSETADYGHFSMQKGEPAVEYFFKERWYAIIELLDWELNTKGWYCDICTPARLNWSPDSGWTLRYTDLALDVYVETDGEATLLDRTEFYRDIMPRLDDEYAGSCHHAIFQLLGMARWKCGPFSGFNPQAEDGRQAASKADTERKGEA